jgi:protein ImuB
LIAVASHADKRADDTPTDDTRADDTRAHDRESLAPFPISALVEAADVDPAIPVLLRGVGIETCGELAALDQEAIEVRFGAGGVRLWRLARGEDRWRPPPPRLRPTPCSSFEWTDYALRDVERMLFVIHGLLGNVSDVLQARGEGARRLTLRFSLDNKSTVEHSVGAARATASQSAWMRLIRTTLADMHFPDAVTGIALSAGDVAPVHARQGDVFDRGFATARAAESAVAQLLDARWGDVMALMTTDHPLPERRAVWEVRNDLEIHTAAPNLTPRLTLQLLPTPQPITVTTARRRDHMYPIQYTDPTARDQGEGGGSGGGGGGGGNVTVDVIAAAGPDEISGGQWEVAPYARSYFQCVAADGRLVLLFRDADGGWYLHGWWD